MSRDSVVASQVAAVQQNQTQALADGLGACYDAGVADAGGIAGGGFTQEQVDAAVAAAVQAKTDEMTAVMNEAQAKFDTEMAAMKVSYDELFAEEQREEQAVKDVYAKIAQVQAAFDAIRTMFGMMPMPAPEPAPEEPPVEPAPEA